MRGSLASVLPLYIAAILPTGGLAHVLTVMDSDPHALLAEATAAGDASVVWQAVLFGIFLGILYDCFRVLRTALGLRHEEHVSALTERLRNVKRRRIPQPDKRVPSKENPCSADNACEADAPNPSKGVRKWFSHKGMQRIGRLPHIKVPDGIKQIFRPAFFMQFILDLLFSLLCGIGFSVFLYWRNAGVLRWYVVLAAIAGFFAYYETIGRIIMHFASFLTAMIRAALLVLYNRTLFYPLWWMHLLARFLLNRTSSAVLRIHTKRNAKRAKKAAAVSKTKTAPKPQKRNAAKRIQKKRPPIKRNGYESRKEA